MPTIHYSHYPCRKSVAATVPIQNWKKHKFFSCYTHTCIISQKLWYCTCHLQHFCKARMFLFLHSFLLVEFELPSYPKIDDLDQSSVKTMGQVLGSPPPAPRWLHCESQMNKGGQTFRQLGGSTTILTSSDFPATPTRYQQSLQNNLLELAPFVFWMKV